MSQKHQVNADASSFLDFFQSKKEKVRNSNLHGIPHINHAPHMPTAEDDLHLATYI